MSEEFRTINVDEEDDIDTEDAIGEEIDEDLEDDMEEEDMEDDGIDEDGSDEDSDVPEEE